MRSRQLLESLGWASALPVPLREFVKPDDLLALKLAPDGNG